ncbi:hypothetical protein GSY69_02625 [Brevibacterium sp. 5221]|uniref:HicB family toxin-antitoxin system n=1 Tax=Brevibacterium rongguiense TaxID=2695267 RepID=A0A6N9H4P6_9MICO|nr:hypothetical protein [Brevibacterium rongguiense]MYM18903.1 hypothetical protein [Brevibacterium rongguiense]
MSRTEPRTLDATIAREGRWWVATVPELDMAAQGRTLRGAQTAAREAAALALDCDEGAVAIRAEIALDGQTRQVLAEVAQLHEEARTAESRAADLVGAVLARLVGEGVSQADAAQVLGISRQRAQQMLKRHRENPSGPPSR